MPILIVLLIATTAVQAASADDHRQCTNSEITSLKRMLGCESIVSDVSKSNRQRQLATAVNVMLDHPAVRCEGGRSSFSPWLSISWFFVQNDHALYWIEIIEDKREGVAKVVISDFNDHVSQMRN